MTSDHPSLRVPMTKGEPRPTAQNDGKRRFCNAIKTDDVVSTVTDDSLIVFHKKFHFPNDLVVMAPKRSDRACLAPPGYLTIYEICLQAGLRFPPPMILIQSHVGHNGIDRFFRDRRIVLKPKCLSRMSRFTCDAKRRITFRSK
ncbi:hypothetical protein IEQ34_017941 [Dendrobium chrysotoxum]|uniref:Uncharacterized protein n=1 Tax=Dendrobium chrysotoxum TaxID=161865 RepID=A0AAV7GDH0_DENCH|nr:hypothetical protein IEQ34_017941 [Dendrobium chrysotoxum]